MRTDQIHPGDLIAGKYRVRAILGRTHGLVIDAFHTEFDQRVVIKILLAGHGDEREIERFRREAKTLSKLESEHAARIIDVGTEADGSFYLVRQFIEGIDLATYIRQSGTLPLDFAVNIALMVAEAAAETHSHGIIIRELQPGHLFLTQRPGGAPLVKISDFGTAKLMRDASAPAGPGNELTATTMFGLSPYSSPELLRKAKNVDARTDVWSLGAIFYELLTCRPPFAGDTTALMLAISREEPTPPSRLRPDLPPELDQIIGWALAKDPDARFKNVYAFAHALSPYASTEGQLLITRIGQINESARRRRTGSAPPPAFPSAPPPSLPPPPALPPPPGAMPEKTTVMSASQLAGKYPQPGGGDDSVTGLRLPPGPEPAGDVRPRSIPPPPSLPPSPQLKGAPASTSRPAALAPENTPENASTRRKIAFGALAIAAVVLPVVVLLLVLNKTSSTPSAEVESAAASASAAVLAAEASAEPSASASAEPSASASAEPAASASAEPAASASAEPAASASAEPAASASASASVEVASNEPPPSKSTSTSKVSTSKASTSKTTSKPTPPPSTGGGTGTLLAVAVGGRCAFSVNGAGKGTSSSIRLTLKPGTYSVSCRPTSGGAKSKSVTVKSGQTAMAAFKL